jgi:hypothetical protein
MRLRVHGHSLVRFLKSKSSLDQGRSDWAAMMVQAKRALRNKPLLTVALISFGVITCDRSSLHEVPAVVIHSNVPFRGDRAQSCSILTGNPFIEGGTRTRVEMNCSERTDFEAAKGDASYPYTRIDIVKLDERAWKEFTDSDKCRVDLFCQAGHGNFQCQLR